MEKPSNALIIKCRHCHKDILFWREDIIKFYRMVGGEPKEEDHEQRETGRH